MCMSELRRCTVMRQSTPAASPLIGVVACQLAG